MLVFLYIIIVLVFHLVPTGNYSFNTMNFGPFRGDHLIHLICFFPWMFLLTFNSHKKKVGLLKGLAWMSLGIIPALGAETIHYWLPHRSFNPTDALFNIAGVVLGAAVFFIIQKLSFFCYSLSGTK
jgi:VanZ family protein